MAPDDGEADRDRLSGVDHVDRAQALIDAGRPQQALPLLTRAVADEPEDSWLRCRLAALYSQLGDQDAAREHAQAALQLDPNSDYAHYQLAIASRARKDFDQSLVHAREAVRIDPDDGANLFLLAWAEYQCGHYGPARDAAMRAVQLDPDSGDLHALLGDLAFNVDDARRAEPHFIEARRLDPANPQHHASLGLCSTALGRPLEAAEHYLQAMKLDPTNDAAREQLFSLLHHDLLDLPAADRDRIVSQLDPALLAYYEDASQRAPVSENLRFASLVALWLCVIFAVTLLATFATGGPVGQLAVVALVLGIIYVALRFAGNVVRRRRARK